MAINKGKRTVEITEFARTWRVEILSEKGQIPEVVVHRETTLEDNAGKAYRQDKGKRISVLATDPKLTKTLAQHLTSLNLTTNVTLPELISAIADSWDT